METTEAITYKTHSSVFLPGRRVLKTLKKLQHKAFVTEAAAKTPRWLKKLHILPCLLLQHQTFKTLGIKCNKCDFKATKFAIFKQRTNKSY